MSMEVPTGWHYVWDATLDGRYTVQVIANDTDWYQGRLQIALRDEVLLDEVVMVAFAAQFGPDMDDVAQWQDRALAFVDERENS